DPRRRKQRLHDRRLGQNSLRRAGDDEQPDHQRSPWRQPRRLRHLQQTAGDDRVGVKSSTREWGLPIYRIRDKMNGPEDKPLILLHGEIKTPPFSPGARREAGFLLRRLQQGLVVAMPYSRAMPN